METIIRITDDGDEGVHLEQMEGASMTDRGGQEQFAMPDAGGAAVTSPPVSFQPSNAPEGVDSDVARPPRRFRGSNRR